MVHRYESWGRTRTPKTLMAGNDGTAITVLAHNATPSGTTAIDGSSGYATENQRYLHVTVDIGNGGAPGRDIEVWVYNRFSAVWSFFTMIDCDAIVQNTTYVIEIYGADRVAFVKDTGDWTNAPDAVYAACSTF